MHIQTHFIFLGSYLPLGKPIYLDFDFGSVWRNISFSPKEKCLFAFLPFANSVFTRAEPPNKTRGFCTNVQIAVLHRDFDEKTSRLQTKKQISSVSEVFFLRKDLFGSKCSKGQLVCFWPFLWDPWRCWIHPNGLPRSGSEKKIAEGVKHFSLLLPPKMKQPDLLALLVARAWSCLTLDIPKGFAQKITTIQKIIRIIFRHNGRLEWEIHKRCISNA